jgi:putative methionine-R-sulfoxide reductase with GAF domain
LNVIHVTFAAKIARGRQVDLEGLTDIAARNEKKKNIQCRRRHAVEILVPMVVGHGSAGHLDVFTAEEKEQSIA